MVITDWLMTIDNLRNVETATHLAAVTAYLDLAKAVTDARDAGETWEAISQVLGTTGHAAQQRFE